MLYVKLPFITIISWKWKQYVNSSALISSEKTAPKFPPKKKRRKNITQSSEIIATHATCVSLCVSWRNRQCPSRICDRVIGTSQNRLRVTWFKRQLALSRYSDSQPVMSGRPYCGHENSITGIVFGLLSSNQKIVYKIRVGNYSNDDNSIHLDDSIILVSLWTLCY